MLQTIQILQKGYASTFWQGRCYHYFSLVYKFTIILKNRPTFTAVYFCAKPIEVNFFWKNKFSGKLRNYVKQERDVGYLGSVFFECK